MPEDRDLVSAVSRGDPHAFRALFREYYPRILGYALKRCPNPADAETVAQETMFAVWKGSASYGERSSVATWIFGIARNKVVDVLRKQGREIPTPPEMLTLASDGGLAGSLERERVEWALEQLTVEHREVVLLTFHHGLSYNDIAHTLDIPEGTVKSRMYYARKKLRSILEEVDDGDDSDT